MRDDAAMLCTECGKNHLFPEPKFQIGQKVLLARPGQNHKDRIGEVTTIRGVWRMFSMPCDEVEYITGLGEGSVSEGRLDPVGEPAIRQIHRPEFVVTREMVESTGPSPLEPAASVCAEHERMRQECQRLMFKAMSLPADVFQGEVSETPRPEFERSIIEAIAHSSPQMSYATTCTSIAKMPPVSIDEVKEICRLMRLQWDDLRAREKATLDRLTGVYSGWPVDPIIAELDRLGFNVYLNIDYDPPCSGNAMVLLTSEGKLVQFKSIHWGLQNEPERANCQDRC